VILTDLRIYKKNKTELGVTLALARVLQIYEGDLRVELTAMRDFILFTYRSNVQQVIPHPWFSIETMIQPIRNIK
jgi:hypothetical protein